MKGQLHMILECLLVKDLFVLYRENELSPAVKEAVDNHLETCEECKRLYGSEPGFSDVSHDVEKEAASRRIDDPMRLTRRVRRLKGIVIVIVIGLVIYSYFQYLDNRRNLLYGLEQLMGNIYHIQVDVETANYGGGDININLGGKLEMLQQEHWFLERDLNFLEKQALNKNENGLFFNYKIESLANLLQDRRYYGRWGKNDQMVYDRTMGYFKELVSAMQKDIDRLRRIRDGGAFNPFLLLQRVDVSYIAGLYAKLDELAVCYTDYDRLPEDVKVLSDRELEKIIAGKLGADIRIDIKDSYRKNIRRTGFRYSSVEVKYPGKDYTSSIDVDAVTGAMSRMNTFKAKYEGDTIPLETVEKGMEERVRKLYGPEFDYKITYKGINYNNSSNTPGYRLYSFDVKPQYKGYEVDTRANENMLYIDAYDGAMNGFFELRRPSLEMMSTSSGNILDAKACLERNKGKIPAEDFNYIKTVYNYSRFTGKYELMHLYRNTKTQGEIYINALQNAGVIE